MSTEAPSHAVAGLASPANLLTFARIVSSPLLFWMILEAEPTKGTSWAAFIFGWIMGASDFFDGRLARRSGAVSRSGAFLDPLADKIVVLGAMFCLVAVGRFAWVPVAIIAARELWISVLRVNFARQGLAVPATQAAKLKTLLQGLVLAAAIAPPLEDEQWFIDGFLWVVVALTVYTGWQYVRDGSTLTSSTGA